MTILGKTDSTKGRAASPERGAPPAEAPPTWIGPGARFVGEVSGNEDIVIEGRFEGNIRVDRRVTVLASGELQGDVQARWVVVGGRVHGQIRADECAELLASASVEGNVDSPKVIIAEGARFEGSVAMSARAASPAAPDQHTAEET